MTIEEAIAAANRGNGNHFQVISKSGVVYDTYVDLVTLQVEQGFDNPYIWGQRVTQTGKGRRRTQGVIKWFRLGNVKVYNGEAA